MAKVITAARAVISIRAGFRWRTSAKTAAMAKITPAAFRRSGVRVGGAGAVDGCVAEWRSERRSGRRRRCSRRAATPMAATTTMATGLRKARRLV